jgi:hypothetical protein
VKNSDLRSELLPKKKPVGLLSIHPQPKIGAFWFFSQIEYSTGFQERQMFGNQKNQIVLPDAKYGITSIIWQE